MKLEKLHAIVPERELWELFTPCTTEEGTIDKERLTATLLDSEYLPRYLQSLARALHDATHKESCLKLLRHLVAACRKHPNREQLDRTIQALLPSELFANVHSATDLHSYARDAVETDALAIDRLQTSPEGFVSRAALLRSNGYQAADYELELIAAADALRCTETPRARTPRIAPHVEATYCPMPEQHFIIAALPKTPETTVRYVEEATARGATLFVSLHEVSEGPLAPFWQESHILASNGPLAIVESTLQRANGTSYNHLHYAGWVDRHSCPDEALLALLLDRMRELSPHPTAPIAINCHGGIGRSGTVAVSYLLRRRIENAPQVPVNVAETILEFRRYRRIVTNSCHYATIHSVLSRPWPELSQLPC